MSKHVGFIFHIRDGKPIGLKDELLSSIAKRRNGKYVCIIKQHREAKTDEQNKYLHVVYNTIAKELGHYETDDIKTKVKSLPFYPKDKLGFAIDTRDLNKYDAARLTENIRDWANAEFNIYVMTPQEWRKHLAEGGAQW